ncbi:hypothetical protein WS91_23860 [Burkholderia sp. MSMB1498]|nr:hypothetical protein WS91_23860 [Burkholderia sp. MSMB1498]
MLAIYRIGAISRQIPILDIVQRHRHTLFAERDGTAVHLPVFTVVLHRIGRSETSRLQLCDIHRIIIVLACLHAADLPITFRAGNTHRRTTQCLGHRNHLGVGIPLHQTDFTIVDLVGDVSNAFLDVGVGRVQLPAIYRIGAIGRQIPILDIVQRHRHTLFAERDGTAVHLPVFTVVLHRIGRAASTISGRLQCVADVGVSLAVDRVHRCCHRAIDLDGHAPTQRISHTFELRHVHYISLTGPRRNIHNPAFDDIVSIASVVSNRNRIDFRSN